jgi:hypothetical protein
MTDPYLRILHQRMKNSRVVAIIAPDGVGDEKSLIELGMAVMLSKPLAILMVPGRPLPEKLLQIADTIIDASDPATATKAIRDWAETQP